MKRLIFFLIFFVYLYSFAQIPFSFRQKEKNEPMKSKHLVGYYSLEESTSPALQQCEYYKINGSSREASEAACSQVLSQIIDLSKFSSLQKTQFNILQIGGKPYCEFSIIDQDPSSMNTHKGIFISPNKNRTDIYVFNTSDKFSLKDFELMRNFIRDLSMKKQPPPR